MRYPGLEMAEERSKLQAVEGQYTGQYPGQNATDSAWHGEPTGKLKPSHAGVRERTTTREEAEALREPVLTMPNMRDLVRANDAVLAEMDSRCTQLEAMGDRVLGTGPCGLVKQSPRFPGDTLGARLWRQNTEMADMVHRLQLAIDRLKQFA